MCTLPNYVQCCIETVHKFLELIFDNTFNFETHIKNVKIELLQVFKYNEGLDSRILGCLPFLPIACLLWCCSFPHRLRKHSVFVCKGLNIENIE